MNKKELIKEIIKDFHGQVPGNIKERAVSLPLNTGKIVTVSGVRRSGKTYLLFAAMERLRKETNLENIIYVNFEDERLDFTKEDLDLILRAYRELYPDIDLAKAWFFFDEMQNIPGWEKFVRRIYDSVSKNIFVTGSNSKLLASDISTGLRGRNLNFEVYPLSFPEYLSFQGIGGDTHGSKAKARIFSCSQDYLRDGGFPELLSLDKSLRLKTLQEYFDVMLFKDLIERFDKKPHVYLVKYFIKRLFNNLASPVSFHKIYNELRSSGYKLDKNLIYELAEELASIYLLFPLHRYSASIIKRELSEKKIYVVDNGSANAVSFGFSKDSGKLLENAVFLHFRAKGEKAFFYKNRKECDFIRVGDNGACEALQVCYDLSGTDTKKREFEGLIEACGELKLSRGTVVTMDDEFEEESAGVKITVLPFWKWALRSHC